jgi:hypothetical protein
VRADTKKSGEHRKDGRNLRSGAVHVDGSALDQRSGLAAAAVMPQ